MFQAVIFDFGGVITESPFEAFNKLETARGLPKDLIRRINTANPHDNAWAKFERAEITPDAFDAAFADEARAQGCELGGRDVIACLSGAVRPSMLEALRRIAARFKTGCITNNVKSDNKHGGMWNNRNVDEAMSLFQHVIESSKAGIRKPDPRIYRMMTDALAVEPKACIYLDDLGINLKPAREMGMTTIKVEAAAPAIAALEGHLGLTLS
ncbi:MAG: HAD-IA family hydrolase [Alphaproteobacteria bacterium]|nr:HAD-IA family hydrolase [Alphaproteobacteria bacterium]